MLSEDENEMIGSSYVPKQPYDYEGHVSVGR